MTFIDINARIVMPTSGRDLLLPLLVNEHGLLMPLFRYFEAISTGTELGTLRDIRHAIKLFCEYTEAVAHDGFGEVARHGSEHARHFRAFRDAIARGTINEKTMGDPTGLRWHPRGSRKADRVIWCLNSFFEWADENGANDAQRFNPIVKATPRDEMLARACYEFRRSKAFLGHTWQASGSRSAKIRSTKPLRAFRRTAVSTKRFPDGQFLRFLRDGFTSKNLSALRNVLITILMNRGGLRISEVMHIWITDVVEDVTTGLARVLIPHPSEGAAPGSWGDVYSNRSHCLNEVFGRRARNELGPGDTEYAGWKSKIDVLDVFWCEPKWGAIFMKLWREYHRRLQEVVPAHARRHPYAFMTFREGHLGRPLPIAAYVDAHIKAIYRAKLLVPGEHIDLKGLGLTTHAHRHAFGNRAKNATGLSRDQVRDMMHHASPDSQNVYTEQTWLEKMQTWDGLCKKLHHDSESIDALLQAFSSADELH